MTDKAYSLIHQGRTVLNSDDIALLRKGMEELPGSHIKFNEKGKQWYEHSADIERALKHNTVARESLRMELHYLKRLEQKDPDNYRLLSKIDIVEDNLIDFNNTIRMGINGLAVYKLHNVPGGVV